MKKIIHKILHVSKKYLFSFVSFIICSLFPVNPKKVHFISFLGKSYSDNPRAISEKLHEIAPDYKIVWEFENPQNKKNIVPKYVKCTKRGSISSLYHILTSAVWIDNYCKGVDTKKRNNQKYVQTWHGDRAIKKILADACSDEEEFVLFESNHCDLAVAGSSFGERMYQSSFLYNGKVICSGCPRNDVLVNHDMTGAKRFRKIMKIDENTKLLLYAPTFRNAAVENQNVDIDFATVINLLSQKTGQKWMLVLRGHTGRHLCIEKKDMDQFQYIDASLYEDTKDVLLAADMVISDYSTVSTDYALLKRPIVLLIEDKESYIENDRALWFDFNDSPFLCANNQNQLIDLLCSFTSDIAEKNCEDILNFYGTNETGHSAEDICKLIVSNAI